MVRAPLVVAAALACTSCTAVLAGAGALIGHAAGDTTKGALIGAGIGLRLDIELFRDLHALQRKLIFW